VMRADQSVKASALDMAVSELGTTTVGPVIGSLVAGFVTQGFGRRVTRTVIRP
jgi:hypothetical protein